VVIILKVALIEDMGYVCIYQENVFDEYVMATSQYCWWCIQTELFVVEDSYDGEITTKIQRKEIGKSGGTITYEHMNEGPQF
jgi:hypothetical protein